MLVPEDAEAASRAEMGEGPLENPVLDYRDAAAAAQTDEQPIGPGRSQGTRGAKEGDLLRSHPPRQELPVMDMPGEEEAGAAPKLCPLGRILVAYA